MGIDRRRGDIGVTQENLNHPDIDAVFQQARRIAVAQNMGRYAHWQSRLGRRLTERAAYNLESHMATAVAVRE